jgi:hypothetical protein
VDEAEKQALKGKKKEVVIFCSFFEFSCTFLAKN